MNTRTELINALIQRFNYKSYLEVGAAVGNNLRQINIDKKRGIDACGGGTNIQHISSNDFFMLLDNNKSDTKFDIVFIDGDHHHDQVWEDINNAERRLNDGGCIVVHDLLPPNQDCELGGKCGSGWRAFAMWRKFPHLDACTLPFDKGCGVILKRKSQQVVWTNKTMDEMTWTDFVDHQHDWLRVIDPRYFGAWLAAGDNT